MTGRYEVAAGLRQMIAALEAERQALAALDLAGLIAANREKLALCDHIDEFHQQPIDGECRALAEAARELNEVNRRVRNLLAANVAARIDALAGRPGTYGLARAAGF